MIMVWLSMRFIDEKLWRFPFHHTGKNDEIMKIVEKIKIFQIFKMIPRVPGGDFYAPRGPRGPQDHFFVTTGFCIKTWY